VWAKSKTSHLPAPNRESGFRAATTPHRNSARQAVRHQFTQAFLLITASFPAKYIIAKELAPHISLTACASPVVAGGEGGFSFPYPRGSYPGKVLDFRPKPQYGTIAA
jgi:hypothetical protein